MGTRMAPLHANIFMAALETRMLHNSPHNLKPLTWLRFINDIFMLWTHGSQTPSHFLQHLTSFHLTINFTHQQSHCSVNFFDIAILITEERTLRYRRIITNDHDLHYHLQRLHKILPAEATFTAQSLLPLTKPLHTHKTN